MPERNVNKWKTYSGNMYIRIYAEDSKHWDDGIGYVVIGEDLDVIEHHMKFSPFGEHPYQTFEYVHSDKTLYLDGDVYVARDIE